MNSILKRFLYYLIGFTIGLIFVLFFFQNRGCAWLPSNRVKNTILDKVIILPASENAIFKAEGFDKNTILSFLNDGDIIFNESIKDQGVFPKVYIIENKVDNKTKRLQFTLYEDSYISPVHYLPAEESAKAYTSFEGMGSILRLPRDSALLYIDQSNYVQCKAQKLNHKNKEKLTQELKTTGEIDFSKSDLMLPKAEHFITFIHNDSIQVRAKTIWFESRITFKDFFWEDSLNCK